MCRTLSDLIKKTHILQYHIALAASKFVDADEHHYILPLEEKLRRVQRHRAAWDTAAFCEPQNVTGEQTSPRRSARITRIHPSGVLIDTTPQGNIRCTRFASPLGSAEQHGWTVSLRDHPGNPLDIAIDPSQDLLVVLFFDPCVHPVILYAIAILTFVNLFN